MYIVVGSPKAVVQANALTSLWRDLFALLTIVGFTLACGWYYGWKKIGLTLAELSETASKVGQGDFSERVKIATDIEELNNLKSTFNYMIKHLSAYHGSIDTRYLRICC